MQFYSRSWPGGAFRPLKRPKWKEMKAQKAKMKGNEGPKGQNEKNKGPKGQNKRK